MQGGTGQGQGRGNRDFIRNLEDGAMGGFAAEGGWH